MEFIVTCLIVCCAKIVEIAIQSVKTVSMVKGMKKIAAMLGFAECIIWGLVVSSIITTLNDNFLLLLAYATGYAVGLYVGSFIEARLAFGTSSVQLMVDKTRITAVEDFLKENNYGFTVLSGHGSKEEMFVVIMVLPRKSVRTTMKQIRQLCEENVFIVSSEVSKFVGGYGVKK